MVCSDCEAEFSSVPRDDSGQPCCTTCNGTTLVRETVARRMFFEALLRDLEEMHLARA